MFQREVTVTFAEPSAPAVTPELPATVALEALEQPISARYLSLQERESNSQLTTGVANPWNSSNGPINWPPVGRN
jgi:hypothetical protein